GAGLLAARKAKVEGGGPLGSLTGAAQVDHLVDRFQAEVGHLLTIGKGAAFGFQLLRALDEVESVSGAKSFLADPPKILVANPHAAGGFPARRRIPVDFLDGKGADAE